MLPIPGTVTASEARPVGLNNGRIDVDGGSGTGYVVCPRGRHRPRLRVLRFFLRGEEVRVVRRCRACPVVMVSTLHGPHADAVRARLRGEASS